jgi:hypothetical protein
MSNQKLSELFEELKALDESLNNQTTGMKKSRRERKTIATEIIGLMEQEGIDAFENYKLIEKTTRKRPSIESFIGDIIEKVQDENVGKLLEEAKSEIAEKDTVTKKVVLIRK